MSSALFMALINASLAASICNSCKVDQSVLCRCFIILSTTLSLSGLQDICLGAFFLGSGLPIKVNIGR